MSVFQIQRKSDKQDFLLLQTQSGPEGLALAKQCSLLSGLNEDGNSPFLQTIEVLEFKGKLFIVLEHLKTAVSLSRQIFVLAEKENGVINDDDSFCKFTLYKVAKALEIMHKNNKVHGDLNTQNVLCDPQSGQIRVVTTATAFSR